MDEHPLSIFVALLGFALIITILGMITGFTVLWGLDGASTIMEMMSN